MFRRSYFIASFIMLGFLFASAHGADENQLKVPGVCTIGAPGKGWIWKPVTEYDAQKGGMYVCTFAGKPGKVILTIESNKVTEDSERITTLKIHFNALRQSLEKLGCTDIKGKRPEVTPPIPDEVDYLVFGKSPKGQQVYFHAHTIFKDQVFLIQAVAPSLAEAQRLVDVSKTLVAGPEKGK